MSDEDDEDLDGRHVCPAHGHPEGTSSRPWFIIKADKLYPAYGHPEGTSSRPWFIIKGDKIYLAYGHPEGTSSRPWFTIKGDVICPAHGHPEGTSSRPWFTIKEVIVMSGPAQDGRYWLTEMQRVRKHDPTFGHWAHALLGLACKLTAAGTLSIQTPKPERWRGGRLERGERVVPLDSPHHNWLSAQAGLLVELSRRPSDPVGRCAANLIDWIIWFWTADACHPRTLAVRRDAIKHDTTHLCSTAAARQAIVMATADGVPKASVVEHEHAVPKRILIDLMVNRTLSPHDALGRFAKAAVVTKGEHRLLNLRYRDRMPKSWDPTNAAADPFARYRDPEVNLTVDSPCRCA